MFKGYKAIDADGHVMEPVDLWDRYLDPEFKHYPINHVVLEGDPQTFSQKLWLNGSKAAGLGAPRRVPRPKYITGKDGVRRDYAEAYKNWIDKSFSAGSYPEFMEISGWDYMVLYPPAGLFITTMPGMDPRVAAALCRAYNSWLWDFCNEGGGRFFGSGKLDTRDPDLAAREARRCIKELGFKAVHVFPQMEEDTTLNDPGMDVLWSEISELNVPLGIHMAQPNLMGPAGQKGVGHLPIGGASAFPMETMIAFLALASGPLERFPDLKVVFLESSASWVPFWVWWLDDRWERASENADTPHPPSFYWHRQCYVSAEPDEPGIRYVKDFQGDDNILTASDFPHPEDATFPYLMEKLVDNPDLSEETKRKILWDNPDRLYHITG